ncbi:MAG: NAD(P)/FAD-dependent oxidoreductase [Planctomycetes bacterium]|nr:NAD(P)/FAD-dependent oxidoreductase [Planctomycetota bacterium]
MSQKFDVIVIGASPSGLIASILVAKAGRRVALVEEPLTISGVRLLSLPALKDALGSVPNSEALMRRITQIRAVSTHGRQWAATEYNTADVESADLVSVEMDDFLSGLGHLADSAGVHRRSGFKSLLVEDGKVRGVTTTEDEHLYARVTIVADGADSRSAAQVAPMAETLAGHQVLYAERLWRFKEGALNMRLNMSAKIGGLVRISGDVLGRLPGATGWIYPGTNTLSLGLTLPREAADESHLSADKALESVAAHPAFAPLLAGAAPEARVSQVRDRGGYTRVRRLFGDGWLIAGDAAGLFDPRCRYELRMEITSGKCAAEAAISAADINDASAMTLGLYKRMLLDSYVVTELRAAEAELAKREKTPDLDAYFPELFVRRLSLGVGAGMTPRVEQQKQFAQDTLNERPLWEIIKAGVGGFGLFG